MANTATLVDSIIKGTGDETHGPVYEYEIVIDTINTDLTIRTPAAGFRLFVVGAFFIPTAALTLTVKSGSAKTMSVPLLANQVWYHELSPDWIFCTRVAEALIIRSNVVFTGGLTLRVVEVRNTYY